MNQITLPQEQLQKLMDLLPHMHVLQQSLRPVVSDDIMKRITKVQDTMNEVFKPFFDAENEEFDRNYTALSKIAKKNGFQSVWSVGEAPAKVLNEKMSGKVAKLVYESWGPTQEVVFDQPQEMTWLELWKAADQLMKQSTDSHHCFVEGFHEDEKNPGTYKLSTGS